jgi:hypothetical protein
MRINFVELDHILFLQFVHVQMDSIEILTVFVKHVILRADGVVARLQLIVMDVIIPMCIIKGNVVMIPVH